MHRTATNDTPELASGQSRDRASLSIPEAAIRMGLSARHVWTLVHTDQLPSFKEGRRRLVLPEDVEAYVRRKRDEQMGAGAA